MTRSPLMAALWVCWEVTSPLRIPLWLAIMHRLQYHIHH